MQQSLNKYWDDYAYISINYRLCNHKNIYSNQFPIQETDVNKAVEYVLANTERWNISNNIVIAGGSAGGHLALLQAYKYNFNKHIKAVIAYFPATDLASMYHYNNFTKTTLGSVLGDKPHIKKELYASSSPINYLMPGSAPTIFFHGVDDDMIPISQSDLLKKRLIETGVPYDYMYIQGEGHGFSEATTIKTIERIRDFLQIYVQ